MKLTLENTQFLCEIAARKLEKQLRGIIPLFIIHNNDNRAKMLKRQQDDILKFEHGAALYAWLQHYQDKTASSLPGLFTLKKKRFLGFGTRMQYIAPIFINIDNDKSFIYHAIFFWLWHAINKADKISYSLHSNQYALDENLSLKEKAENNLKADIFAAFMTESDQESGFIEKLTTTRAKAVLEKNTEILCETYPYPQVAEACRFIYDDLKYSLKEKEAVITFALKMANEITGTYGTEAIDQWIDFSCPAQHMVWAQQANEQILNSAVFTSEDTQTRATAHLVCDQIGFKPEPDQQKNNAPLFYNPFLKSEVNAQNHKKICENLLKTELMNMSVDYDSQILSNLIHQQNEQLLSGNPLGWCADALSEVMNAFNDKIALDHLPEIFEEALQNTSWPALAKAAETIITSQRKGEEFSLFTLSEALENLQGRREILKALGGSSKSEFSQAQKIANPAKSTRQKTSLHIALEAAGQQILGNLKPAEKEKAAQ